MQSSSSSRSRRLYATLALEKLEESLAKDSMPFRLLNALLEHAPTTEGRRVIATDIIIVSEMPDGLRQLAEFYKTGLLLPMKAGGSTLEVSDHPSRDPEVQSEPNKVAVDLELAARDPRTLKKYALHRDGYRCVTTRKLDLRSLSPAIRSDPSTKSTAITEAAYILPLSLLSSADLHRMLANKCTIWAVIESLSIELEELSVDNINSLQNVITLDLGVYTF